MDIQTHTDKVKVRNHAGFNDCIIAGSEIKEA